MTFSINYDASVVDGSMSVSDFLTHWSAHYTEVYYNHAEIQFTNYAGYWATTNEESWNIEYEVGSTINGITALYSEGTWGYDSETFEFYDAMNTLHFGEGLALDPATGFYLTSETASFDGLGEIIAEPYLTGGFLLYGDVSLLLLDLEAAGIDTTASLESYVMVSGTEDTVDTTGVQDNSDTLMAA